MIENRKKILIVDDSEIDREILKSIVNDEFEVIEANNGYSALEIIMKQKEHFDALLLDVSMPVLDGLSVLRLLRENNFEDVPVFMITAEATKDNIEKASQYKVAEFIKKPFDRDEILRRLRLRLGVMGNDQLSDRDVKETKRYILHLGSIYDRHLSMLNVDKGGNVRRVELMRILLQKAPDIAKETDLDKLRIDIISSAAYFCDIGYMLIPNKLGGIEKDKSKNMNQDHTVLGSDLIQLNYSKRCSFFVQICADMCLHHHERYDGKGYPHGMIGNKNSIYTQMCGLADRFDKLFFKYTEHNEMQFDFVSNKLAADEGTISEELLSLLNDCKKDILSYYGTNYV